MNNSLTFNTKKSIVEFIKGNFTHFKAESELYNDPDYSDEYMGLCLTLGVSSDGSEWSYQTGCNHYNGGAYLYPNWVVVYIHHESDMNYKDLCREIFDQYNELEYM